MHHKFQDDTQGHILIDHNPDEPKELACQEEKEEKQEPSHEGRDKTSGEVKLQRIQRSDGSVSTLQSLLRF